MFNTKQVILVRKDLNMSIGKTAAQVGHDSIWGKLFRYRLIENFIKIADHHKLDLTHLEWCEKYVP